MQFFNLLGKLLDRVNSLMIVIAAFLLIALTVIVGTDITLRYGFSKPLGWVKETSEYILVFLGFLVAAWILKDDGHVKMDLILSRISPRAQTLMNIITSAVSTLVVLIVSWYSLTVTIEFYRTKLLTPSVLELPKWIFILPIFVGSLLLAAQFLRRTWGLFAQWRSSGMKPNHESSGGGKAGT
jgi:C4-dicarboxylate transporter, DctQ subunit